MMKRKSYLLLFLLLSGIPGFSQSTGVLKNEIQQLLAGKQAKVGVAVCGPEPEDTLGISEMDYFPMQSVYKFHLGLAVLNQVDKNNMQLDKPVEIQKSELMLDTWSPIVSKFPNENFTLTLSELLHYTVAESDNNACDLLFGLLGGTSKVNAYIHQQGIKTVDILATEREMAQAWPVQYTNRTSPRAAVMLLDKFRRGEILSPASTAFLRNEMIVTPTGSKRLKGLLPAGTCVAHKTGTSGRNSEGIRAATNDIGIVDLPNGKQYCIAVFVSDSKETDAENEYFIARISQMVWEYFQQKY